MVERHCAIDGASPRASESKSSAAPGVSISVTTGRLQAPASRIARAALRYPSALIRPPLRRACSSSPRPRSWPITMTVIPPRSPTPQITAGSSRLSAVAV